MNYKLHLVDRMIINKRILGILICMLFIIPLLSSSIISATDNWSMFHHDQLHTGYSSSTAPITNNVLWSFSTNDNLFSSPTVVDGKLYIGSDDRKIYCLDAEDGHELWNSSVGGEVWESSPAVANDMVYIGGGATFYCFNAENGSTIWSYATGNPIRSSPVVINDRVYIGSWDRKVYCFDADTSDGEDEGYDDLFEPPIVNYDLIWIFETGNLVDSSPAVYDNKVLIGSNDKKLYCLNAINGTEIWNFATGGNVFSSPAIANDKVYVGSYDHKLYCVDITTGLENWSFTTGDIVTSSPATRDGKVYVGSNDGNVYCLDALTGESSWGSPFGTGGNVFSSPAITDNKIYIGSGDNKLYCLYSNNGTKIWEYATGGPVSSSPAVYDGKIYVGSLDNTIYCFEDNHAPVTPTRPIGPSEGTLDEEYIFTTKTSEPDGDQIQYGWDWNSDLVVDEWTTFYDPDVTVQISHIFSAEGTSEIRTKAKDIFDAESGWSNPLRIEIKTNEEEQTYGWIFGTITNNAGDPINSATVCVTSANDQTSTCKTTDVNGRYQFPINPGIYSVKASKQGYKEHTKLNIGIIEKQALELNFELEQIQTSPTASTQLSYVDYTIQQKGNEGTIGAQVHFESLTETSISYFSDDLIIDYSASEEMVACTVAAPSNAPGTIIAIRVGTGVLKDLDDVGVRYDGVEILEETNVEEFFGDLESTTPSWLRVLTQGGLYVFVKVTSFSEHTITITTLAEIISDITAIMLYLAFFAMAGVIFTAVVVVFLVKFVYSKK